MLRGNRWHICICWIMKILSSQIGPEEKMKLFFWRCKSEFWILQKWIPPPPRLLNLHHTGVFRDTQTVGVSAACYYPTVWSQIVNWPQSDTMSQPEPEPVITNTETPVFTGGVQRTCLRTYSTVLWRALCSHISLFIESSCDILNNN